MAKRRRIYKKRRKVNYGRVLIIVLLVVAAAFIISMLFRTHEYMNVIDETLKSDIREISGTVNSTSDIDINVYSNNGIRYTNQHENIKKLNSFDSANADDSGKAGNVKMLFEILQESKKASLVNDLPLNENGYYWIDADFIVEDKKLIFDGEEKYDFDLYYDIENKNIYIKEKYFSQFSKKNNNQKLQGYEASEEFVKLIEELAGKE